MKQSQKTLALWIVIVLLSLSAVHFFNTRPTLKKTIGFSEFLAAVKNNRVEEVVIQGEEYTGKYKPDYEEGGFFSTVGPANSERAVDLITESSAQGITQMTISGVGRVLAIPSSS